MSGKIKRNDIEALYNKWRQEYAEIEENSTDEDRIKHRDDLQFLHGKLTACEIILGMDK